MVDLKIKTAFVSLCHLLWFLTNVAAAQNPATKLMLWTWSDHPLEPGLSRALQTELAKMTVPEFAGIDTHAGIDPSLSTSDAVVTVRFTGQCNAYSGYSSGAPAALGHVMLTDGAIAPSMWVNCDAILCALEPLLRDLPKLRRNILYAQAIVRIIQHELRHILEQTASHLARGVFKASLSASDLTSVPMVTPQ